MYTYSKIALAVTFLSLTSFALAGLPPDGYVQSCTSGQCDNCTTGNNGGSRGSENWDINYQYPSCEIYSSATFAGAQNKGGQGYNVWWNIGKPAAACKIIVMSPVGQEVAGTNCGNVVLKTDQAGCFFTNLDHTFMVQYCCGAGNCDAALGASKRDLQDIPALIARAEAAAMDGESFAFPVTMNGSNPLASFDLNQKRTPLSARKHLPNVPQPKDAETVGSSIFGRHKKPKCGPSSNEGDSYTKPGTQTQMKNTLECASDQSCNQQVRSSITVSPTPTNFRPASRLFN